LKTESKSQQLPAGTILFYYFSKPCTCEFYTSACNLILMKNV